MISLRLIYLAIYRAFGLGSKMLYRNLNEQGDIEVSKGR